MQSFLNFGPTFWNTMSAINFGPIPANGLKILTVSDFEDNLLIRRVETRTLEPVDLILSCGDLDPEFLSFLRDRLDRPLFYVKGNHDIRYTPTNPVGCENIHQRIVTFNKINILGLEGSMWYNGGANQYTEAMMKNKFSPCG
jgi:predicted phosphodiesterase